MARHNDEDILRWHLCHSKDTLQCPMAIHELANLHLYDHCSATGLHPHRTQPGATARPRLGLWRASDRSRVDRHWKEVYGCVCYMCLTVRPQTVTSITTAASSAAAITVARLKLVTPALGPASSSTYRDYLRVPGANVPPLPAPPSPLPHQEPTPVLGVISPSSGRRSASAGSRPAPSPPRCPGGSTPGRAPASRHRGPRSTCGRGRSCQVTAMLAAFASHHGAEA